jgi:hypothetical protein
MANKINPRDHVGETHGIYTIVDMLSKTDKYGHWIYKCICNECGHVKYCHYGRVSSPSSIAHTCTHKHIHCENNRIGSIFNLMIRRCYSSSDKDYKWYGKKGIEVCNEWLDSPKLFEEWALSNGYQDDLTIDRIESDKNYCPTNCRWITLEDNSRRSGKVNWIAVDEETLTGKQWAEKLGIGVNIINRYIRQYSLEKTVELIKMMLKEPPKTKNRKFDQTWFDVYGIQV